MYSKLCVDNCERQIYIVLYMYLKETMYSFIICILQPDVRGLKCVKIVEGNVVAPNAADTLSGVLFY